MNVPEPTEEGEMGREESVGGDGLVFGYNFLPPFANAENKALNSDIKASINHYNHCCNIQE